MGILWLWLGEFLLFVVSIVVQLAAPCVSVLCACVCLFSTLNFELSLVSAGLELV